LKSSVPTVTRNKTIAQSRQSSTLAKLAISFNNNHKSFATTFDKCPNTTKKITFSSSSRYRPVCHFTSVIVTLHYASWKFFVPLWLVPMNGELWHWKKFAGCREECTAIQILWRLSSCLFNQITKHQHFLSVSESDTARECVATEAVISSTFTTCEQIVR
jgi:hypothetical protein